MNAESLGEFAGHPGVPSRYIDAATVRLNQIAATYEIMLESRIRVSNRGDKFGAALLKQSEDQYARLLGKALKDHVLWPWLQPLKGLAGPRTARVIAAIGDPRRFPGQPCTEGHYLPPLYPVGAPCPIEEVPRADRGIEGVPPNGSGEVFDDSERPVASESVDGVVEPSDTDYRPASGSAGGVGPPDSDERHPASGRSGVRCPGVLLPPRTTTGTRSLWHYFGLNVADGRLPRLRKGVQADWNGKARTLILGPNGIADQIVKHRTPKYRDIYDEAKARKLTLVDRPIQAEKIARTIAAKAFLGDLLAEWKRFGGAEIPPEIDPGYGPAERKEAS